MARDLFGKPANDAIGRQMAKWRYSYWPYVAVAALYMACTALEMTRSLPGAFDDEHRIEGQNLDTPFHAKGRNDAVERNIEIDTYVQNESIAQQLFGGMPQNTTIYHPAAPSMKEELVWLRERVKSLEEQVPYSVAPDIYVAAIYDTLKEVVETLNKAEGKLRSQWFADGGTLLGALRCHPPGMMKWDDDVDLAVKTKEHLEELHGLLKSNPRLQWRKHGQFLAYKYALVAHGDRAWFGVEMLGLGLVNSEWQYLDRDGLSIEENFADTSYEDEDVQGVVPCRFWDLTLNCPSGGLEAMRRTFGKDALVEANIFNHGDDEERPNINLANENLNQHSAYFPAMTRDLMRKLTFSSQDKS